MTVPARVDSIRWLTSGTAFLLRRVDAVDLSAPSALPGWSNGHVVAHVSRNADAVGRLLHWAASGVETPMYASADARASEIARDVQRPDDVQRADAHTTADRFAAAVDALAADAWHARVRSARGRLIGADEIPWLRVKEVWLHGVDLGASIEDLPGDTVDALLGDVAGAFAAKEAAPGLRLRSPAGEWVVGDGGQRVQGPAALLLGWLTGRGDGSGLESDRALPALPSWL